MATYKEHLMKTLTEVKKLENDATRVKRMLENELKKMLGSDYNITVQYSTNLGRTLQILFYEKSKGSFNSPVHFQFRIGLYDPMSEFKDSLPTEFAWYNSDAPKKITVPTKISGKNLEEATKKLLSWLKTQKPMMDYLVAESRL